METINDSNLILLTKEEQMQTNGGLIPILWAIVGGYVTLCALAEAAGTATAYIVNKLR